MLNPASSWPKKVCSIDEGESDWAIERPVFAVSFQPWSKSSADYLTGFVTAGYYEGF